MQRLTLVVFIGLLGLSGSACAGVIDFSDLTSGNCNFLGSTANSGGFTFTDESGSGNGLFLCNGNVVANSSLVSMISANGRSSILMAAQSAGTFTLNSFDAGARTDSGYGTATGIDVLGTYGNSSTVDVQFSLTGFNFQTFTLPGTFANVVSVEFSALGTPSGSFGPEFAFNNIVFNGAASVPEPASCALLGAGLLGIWGLRRRSAYGQLRNQPKHTLTDRESDR
jgi:hypothetical protein